MNKDNKFNIGGGFNVDSTQPIDSRTVAKSKAELTLTGSTWNSGTTYNGLLVSVVDTNNPDDDGIYMLIDSPRMWMEESWIKIGTEGGDTGDTKLFDTYALVLKDSNISVAVDKNDNYVYGLPNQNYIKVLNDDGDYKDMNEVILTISNIDTPSEAVAYNYKWQGGTWVMGETGSTPNVYTINNVSGNSKQFNFEISADTSNTLSDAIVNIVAKFKEAGANTYIAAGSIKINTIVADTIYNLLSDASVVVGVMTEDGYMPTPPSVAITGVSIESIEETGILIDQSQVEERGLNITYQVYKRSGGESAVDYELGSAITIDVSGKTSKVVFNLYDTNSGETLLDVVEIPVIWDGEPGRNASTNAFDFDNENLNLGADASGNYSFGLSQHNEAYFYYGNIKGTFEIDDDRTLDVYDNAGGAPIFTMTGASANISGVTLWCDVDEDDNDHVLVDIAKETPSSNVTFFKFDKAPYTFKVTTTTYVDGQQITGVSATFKVNMRKDLAVYDILPTVNAVSMKYDSGYKPISGTPTAITSNLKVITSNGTDIYKAPNVGLPEGVQGFSLKVNDYIGATGHTTGDDTGYSGNSVFIFSMGNPTAVTLDGTDSILVGADGAQGVTGLTSVTFKQPKGLVFALLDDYADENETVPFLYDGVQGEKGQRGAQGAQGVPGDPSDAYIMDIDNDTVILSCDNNGVYQYGYENIDLKVFINTNIPVYSAKTITGEVRGTSTGLTTLFDTGYTDGKAFTIKAKTGTSGSTIENELKNINLLTDPIFIDITGIFEKPATSVGGGTDEFSSTAVLKIIGTIGYPTDICLATSATTIEKVGGINAWVNGGVWNYSCGNSLQPAVSVYDGSTNTLIGISNFNATKVNEKYRKIKVSVSGSANTKEVRYLDLASGNTHGHGIVLSGDGKCILTGYETAESGSTTSTAEIAKPRTMVLSFTNSGINDSEDISIVYDGATGPQGPQGNGGANGVGSQDIYTYWSGATAVTEFMTSATNKTVYTNDVANRFNNEPSLTAVTAYTQVDANNTVQLTYYRSPQECTMEAPTLFAFRRYFTGGNWGSFDYAWVYSRYAASTPGRSGKMLYPAGQYDENAQYTVTSGTTPYVCITADTIGEAAYYYINSDTDSSTTKTGLAWAKNNHSFDENNEWKDEVGDWVKMDSFAAIYGDIGIFNTALVGQAVFYKEFILSQDGVMVKQFKTSAKTQTDESGITYTVYDQNFGTSDDPDYAIYVGTANVSGGDYYNKFMNNTACHTYYNSDIYTPSGNFFLNNPSIEEFFKPNYVVNLSTGFVSNREGTYGPIKYTQNSFMTEYNYKGQTASTIFSIDSDGLYFGTDAVKKVRFFAFANEDSVNAVNALITDTITNTGSTNKAQIFFDELKASMESGGYSGQTLYTLYGQPSSLTYSEFFSSAYSSITASNKAIYDRLKGLGWYDDTDVTNYNGLTWKAEYGYYKNSTTSANTESLYPYELNRLVGYEVIFENTTDSQTGNSINITREGGTEINGALSVSSATTIGGSLRVGNGLTIEMPSSISASTGYTMTVEAIDINDNNPLKPKLKFTVVIGEDLSKTFTFTLNPDS